MNELLTSKHQVHNSSNVLVGSLSDSHSACQDKAITAWTLLLKSPHSLMCPPLIDVWDKLVTKTIHGKKGQRGHELLEQFVLNELKQETQSLFHIPSKVEEIIKTKNPLTNDKLIASYLSAVCTIFSAVGPN